jgi:Flp pilus assembly protein TadG
MRLGERGSATVELAVVAPTLMLLILGVLQFGLWYHAQHVVQTAALESSRVVAAEEGTVEEARLRADEVLTSGLGSTHLTPAVEVVVAAETVSVTVRASMNALVPLMGPIGLSAEAVSYKEGFRPAREQP